MPRSAFLEGAREAGGTKTCTGAIAKQKTAAPQGAASLSLAVLESDGRKREGVIDSEARWVGPREMDNPGSREKSRSLSLQTRRVGRRWLYAHGQEALAGHALTFAATGGIARRITKLPDAGISLKQCPENERQKKAGLLNCGEQCGMDRGMSRKSGKQKVSCATSSPSVLRHMRLVS